LSGRSTAIARRALVQVLAHEELEQADVHDVLALGDADFVSKSPDRRGWKPAPADAGDRGHPRVVPAVHAFLVHKLEQLALAHHRVRQIQARELDLLRCARQRQVVHEPVVERPVVFELERADGMRDALERVRDRMRVVVHRVDRPRIARPVVVRAPDAVQDRVAHVDVRRRHIDLRAQHSGAIGKLAGAHAPEQIETFG
jgi:hypothetical protein